MSKQESFKRRVRQRMAKTGERYTTARKMLLEQTPPGRRRTWKAEPEAGEDAVVAATGKGWEDWCDIIDAWPGHTEGHTAIAAYLGAEHGVDMWWSQQITGGYERITGLRLPYERPDGTFTAGKSRTLNVDGNALRSLLLDADARTDLFPGHHSELRSRPTAKAIRIAIGPGVVQFGIDVLDGGRAKVSVSHEKLPTYELVEEWKFYWTDWLDALEGAEAAVEVDAE